MAAKSYAYWKSEVAMVGESLLNPWVSALVPLISAGVGAYLGAYLNEKGKNFARREDMDKITAEVQAVTRTTEAIKADISGGLWDRQKQWEMKKEVLFEASKSVASVEERIARVQAVLTAAKDRIGQPDWMDAWHDALIEWREVISDFERTLGLVNVVCSLETNIEFLKLRSVAASMTDGLAKKDPNVYDKRSPELSEAAIRVRFAIRKELGVPALQSTESSAAPTPVKQAPEVN
jgi:hypothetical protein